MVRGSWALVGASAHVPDAGNPKTVDSAIRLASSPVPEAAALREPVGVAVQSTYLTWK